MFPGSTRPWAARETRAHPPGPHAGPYTLFIPFPMRQANTVMTILGFTSTKSSGSAYTLAPIFRAIEMAYLKEKRGGMRGAWARMKGPLRVRVTVILFNIYYILYERKWKCWSLSHVWLFATNPMDCSLPGSSVHGILQARILEWVAIPFSRGSSQTQRSDPGFLHFRQILYHLSHQGSLLYCKVSTMPRSLLVWLEPINHWFPLEVCGQVLN